MNLIIKRNLNSVYFKKKIKRRICQGIYCIGSNVKKTGSPAPPVVVVPAEEVLLSMACNLSRSSCFHIVS